MLRVTVSDSALQAGRFRSQSWFVVKAVDWVDCGDSVYFFARERDGWHTVIRLSVEDVAAVQEI
jgi:hypothetical protein